MRPGGERVKVINPLNPTRIRTGVALSWTNYGSPTCIMEDNGETRGFPADWVTVLAEVPPPPDAVDEVQVAKATAALLQADSNLRRDRWGYELDIDHLEVFARFTLENLPGNTMAELTNTIILAMMITEPANMPVICSAVDEPADDDHIETLVQIILDALRLPHPEPGVREV